ncbi:MAG: T9SS type A sorting domain-containing protein [Gemmatimonadetes bacterium]|nr:T9SS type A sorting domain-containing protein [Gemmatimonadota bacterium]
MRFLIACLLLLATNPAEATCPLPDNGSGTIDLPPNCGPEGFQGSLSITAGLPLGTAMELDASLRDFVSMQSPGGVLGGTIETFTAIIDLQVTGSGDLSGFARSLSFGVNGELHVAPHPPGATTIDVTMYRLRGKLENDFDFALLEFEGGDVYGLDSPGETVLVSDGSGGFLVDAFFDYAYRIQWEGMRDSLWLDGGRGIDLDLESPFVLASTATAVDPLPTGLGLRAFPNPSPGWVRLQILGDHAPDVITIFDARGRRVRTLDTQSRPSVVWDGRDTAGRSLASGVYFARTRGGSGEASVRWILRR